MRINMEITYLIGNGFDINQAIDTKYSDFYKSISINKIIKNNIYNNIIGFEISDIFILNKLKKYLINTDENNLYRIQIDKNTTDLKKRELIKLLQSSINIKRVSCENWSDLEKGLGEYIACYITENNKDEFSKDYLELLDDLKDYLKNENNKFKLKEDFQNEIVKSFIKFPDEFIKGNDQTLIRKMFENIPIRYHFISFNYTFILDGILEKTRKLFNNNYYFGNVIHIHGTINNNMILGVNDISQLTKDNIDKDFVNEDNIVIQCLIKPKCNDLINVEVNKKASNIIDNSNIICMFGISMGETDKKWMDSIIEWLRKSTQHILIIYYRDTKLPQNMFYMQYEIQATKIKQIILAFGNTKENNDLLEKQIIIVFNSNIFKFSKEIINNEVAITDEE